MTLWEHIHYIGPALTLLVGAGAVFSIDLIAGRRAPVWGLTLLVIVVAFGWTTAQALDGTAGQALSGSVVVDRFSIFVTFILLVSVLAVTMAARDWLTRLDGNAEFLAMLLVATGSMALLVQANDLITLFIALETTSIAQFIMAGMARTSRSAEAGLKYLLTGAVAAAVLLYGFAFLFGISGSTELPAIADFVRSSPEGQRLPLLLAFVFIAAGFGYKMALAPFHAWAPDVYEGAPAALASFISVASKAAGFAIALRVFYTGLGGGDTFVAQDWAMVFGGFAAISMLFGNIGALAQTSARRLLGYSSIAQAGNIAIGIAAVAAGSTMGPSGVLFFLGTYAATNLGAFIAVTAVQERLGTDEIADYAGLMKRSPLTAGVLTLCLLSLTGIPPTAGFIAKVYVFNAAVQADQLWLLGLVALAVLNTAISAFYYLRWVRTMWLDEPKDAVSFRPAGPTQAVLLAAMLGVLFFGMAPTWLITAAQRAAASLL
ncbi:MAG: NADH-quinone oxidoreductase subunit N [Chloroflexi bacterium]|nr:NADH-quinone oxidoreductase subunit N [Chloroflexota bacterium]MDA1239965.1 NADH-quinone oxidoreductase subunit N [Chloroflexota bacterium]MQC25422.1 NADH-quinone oxidoreductase subunit N [Chloroflexota bacterium]